MYITKSQTVSSATEEEKSNSSITLIFSDLGPVNHKGLHQT